MPQEIMEDKTIKCVDCGDSFIFTKKDQVFFSEHHFTEPKRCKDCRRIRRINRESEGKFYKEPWR